MKAVRYHKFGSTDVLKIEEVSDLNINDDEILVEVYSTIVNAGDCHLRGGNPFLARLFAGPITPRNKILGSSFSGKVVAIGNTVKKYKVGDEIMGSLGINTGSHAQFLKVNEKDIVIKKPTTLTHEEAVSLVFGSLSAKYFLDKANLTEGQDVLIIGASGGVGSYAVQYATALGAKVIGVCSESGRDFVLSLGAKETIDYKTTQLKDFGQKFDLILDTAGREKKTVLDSLLKESGTYVTTVMKVEILMAQLFSKKKKYIFDIDKATSGDLEIIMDLVLEGNYRPLIDTIYKMDDIKLAYEHVEEKSRTGAIVINI